jgi:hypothetical protein
VFGEAVVVGTRFGTPYGAHYRVEMAPDWTVRRVLVALTDGRTLVYRLTAMAIGTTSTASRWRRSTAASTSTFRPRHSRIPCQSAGSG